jgi:histidyl-tRNA synthetase
MSQLQPVRGTRDIFGAEAASFRWIEQTAHSTALLYGFEEISTPIFEFKDVFHRTLGETSDVVSKETYTFTDRGGDDLTLRPEGTAGIARAFISGGMAQNLPLKFYYSGPMFRHERPQKGRYRQFHQIGVEVLGIETPSADIEVIAYGWHLLKKLGLADSCRIEINTLGDQESRTLYRNHLVQYFNQYQSQLSPDSQVRLEKNPLRILDSKDPNDRKIIENAPKFKDFLNSASTEFYNKVLMGLRTLEIPFVENEHLVRGLDYYCHTVFEITTTHLGAQGTVLAGGRYDGLIELMGGNKTPGVGWASGIERLALLSEGHNHTHADALVALLPADDSAEMSCLKLSQDLRLDGLRCELLTSGNVGKKMKRANKLGARFAIIIGESELQKNTAAVKDLRQGTQEEVAMHSIATYIKKIIISG